MEFNQKKEKTMKHELVHETVNIKGWDMVDRIDWKIGEKTELPFDDHPKLIRPYITSMGMIR